MPWPHSGIYGIRRKSLCRADTRCSNSTSAELTGLHTDTPPPFFRNPKPKPTPSITFFYSWRIPTSCCSICKAEPRQTKRRSLPLKTCELPVWILCVELVQTLAHSWARQRTSCSRVIFRIGFAVETRCFRGNWFSYIRMRNSWQIWVGMTKPTLVAISAFHLEFPHRKGHPKRTSSELTGVREGCC